MSEDIIININKLTKVYKLYDSPQDRLKEALHPLRKKYHKEFHAIDDISLDIRRGETVGIIGQNGAGKSTLLKMITGVLTPTSGSVSVNGKISALLELGAGFNPQLTGLENVYFNGTLMGYTHDQIDNKLEEILSFADIGDFIRQPVITYSSGMFVRLAFAVAVNVEPEILIVDEALSVGDMMFQAKCYDKIRSLMSGGVTTLFVTHNMNTISSLCNSAYLLDSGKIFAHGAPNEVTRAYFRLQREMEHARQDKTGAGTKPDGALRKKSIQPPQKKERDQFISGTAEITEFKVFNDEGEETFALRAGADFSVWMKVVFTGEVENPCVGMMIKSPQGQNLLGVHSYHERRMSLGYKQCGDEIEINFICKMLLNPGKYMLNLSVSEHTTDFEYKSIDIKSNAAALEVYGKDFAFGLIHNDGVVILN
ncbi:ABC transporter ATP-binding protein [Geomonas terrae]|uniref:ABC transporter ATP-binding protein n=1 Tax=Geomonas terrae TaxID=2562681 RepID=A0A4S1CA90_9BACT|nr:ABC transporter ATP-binding protein [Geomonas terrae]TGU70217.1 ABC transporter ATP-binding protein [Geomonas terrae]